MCITTYQLVNMNISDLASMLVKLHSFYEFGCKIDLEETQVNQLLDEEIKKKKLS